MESFRDLGIEDRFIKGIEELGYIEPTPIQKEVIPKLIREKTDLIGLAQTGTGKTAAFGFPLLQSIDVASKTPQGLILCPTRELCVQINNDLNNFTKFERKIKTVAVYGGASINTQISSLRAGAQIIVATPGRMLDLLRRGSVKTSGIKCVILDEADEMFNMGFKDELNGILETIPDNRLTWLFSATMSKEVKKIAVKYMNSPAEFKAKNVNFANVNIDHEYYVIRARDKYSGLKRIIDFNPDIYSIVFTRTKRDAQEVAELLIKDRYNADCLHGDISQSQREKTLNRFRNKSLQILVATDVAARGIDVNDITHIINYTLPDEPESYTHRSGRTARAGKTGVSISLVAPPDLKKINFLKKILQKEFVKCEFPSGFDVCEKQLFSLIHRVRNVEVNEEQIATYFQRVNEEFGELDKEEIIKRFMALEFNRFLDFYKNASDLNEKIREDRVVERIAKNKDKKRNRREEGMKRIFVGLGFEDGLTRGDIFRLVIDMCPVQKESIGQINTKTIFSFVDIREGEAEVVLKNLKEIEFKGRDIKVEYAKSIT